MARIRSIAYLSSTCQRCQHQIATHVGGRSKTGWPVYDDVWQTASGWCATDGCDCPAAIAEYV